MKFKVTQYFLYTRQRSDRVCIKDEWIKRAIDNPLEIEIQSDGRIKKWIKIEEEDKYLRVILLSDNKTVHNAFFDRNYKKDKK